MTLRIALAALVLLIVGGLTGCSPEPHRPSPTTILYPHATDRLVRLIDKGLNDTTYSAAAPDQYAVNCEYIRLHDAFGIGEGEARIHAVLDSFQVHDRSRIDRLNRVLGGHVMAIAAKCPAANAVADSTDPLPHWPHG
jgi:hypothetical protein